MPMGDPSAKPYRWRDTPRSEAGGADRQTAKPGRWRGAWHWASYPGHEAHAHSRHSRLDGAAVARSEAPQEAARLVSVDVAQQSARSLYPPLRLTDPPSSRY